MPPPSSGGKCLAVWFEFLVTNNCEMNNEITERTIKSHTSSKFKIASCLAFIPRFAIFVRKRELGASALCCWATTNLLMSKFRQFVSLCEERMLPAEAQIWWLKSGSFPLLSLGTDALMVTGNVAYYLKERLHNKSSSKWRTGLIIAFLAK